MQFQLRPYQEECLAAIPESGRYLIQMATGLGKSVTFSRVPYRKRMLILSHREELVHQTVKYFDVPVGIEQCGSYSTDEPVVSASVQSLIGRLDNFDKDAFDVIITDEAHHAAAPSYRRIYEHFEYRLHLGFTATPNRGDKVRLDDIYEKIIFQRDLRWGIQNGYLSDIRCLRANIGYDLSGVARRLGDYAVEDLERVMNTDSMNQAIAQAYTEYAVGQTLIFATSVKHAQDIAALIPGSVAITGGTKDRADIVQAFLEKKIRCVVNCVIFTEGTDIPNIETIIIARPTANTALYTQMVGRGLRKHPGKERLTLVDCVGISGKLNLCTAPSLLGIDIDKVPKGQQDLIQGDLFDLPSAIEKLSDTPMSWIKNVEYVDIWAVEQQVDTRGINFYKMPDGRLICCIPEHKFTIAPPDELGDTVLMDGRNFLINHALSLQDAIDALYAHLKTHHASVSPIWDISKAKRGWGKAVASDKQMGLIRRRFPKIDFGVLTKLEASQVLNRMFAR